ncbi:MAG: AAA family ATPase [Blautia sp.]|nr:AAA family ATPase [Blautia sp.]
MGTYLNPGNSGFAEILESDYVDKTGLIALINSTIGTKKKLTCISRPRRFGKSYAAQMLCAYYDKTCDSHDLFAGYEISRDKSYEDHLGKYDVIYWDMAAIKPYTEKYNRLVPFLIEKLSGELTEQYPGAVVSDDLSDTLSKTAEKLGNKFIILIDEWDAPIRENPSTQQDYLEFLRSLFKNSGTTSKIFAAAYMTGILPIKKDGSQSAISDFQEYSMLEPLNFAGYFGFTEDEVRSLCDSYKKSFYSMKKWYDGYTVGECRSIYNPYSVMQALGSGKYRSYWKRTSAAETLMTYIDMDQDGLQDEIARLVAGESVIVDTDSFQNDVETFSCKDDVLTLLIHLGYLTYEEVSDSYGNEEDEEQTGLVRIPNEEVRSEFETILRKAKHKSLIELVKRSDRLLQDTISGNSDAVAKAVQEVHDSEYAPTYYNNEQSLRYVVKMAYISCVDQYGKVEELPTGHGIADVVFVPKRRSTLPAMIVELKWDQSAEGAVKQIKEKNYPKVLEQFDGEILLVGLNYDVIKKKHTCSIQNCRR